MDFYCKVCGSPLSDSISNSRKVEITPCEKCVDAARNAAYSDGYDEGYDEGMGEGISK